MYKVDSWSTGSRFLLFRNHVHHGCPLYFWSADEVFANSRKWFYHKIVTFLCQILRKFFWYNRLSIFLTFEGRELQFQCAVVVFAWNLNKHTGHETAILKMGIFKLRLQAKSKEKHSPNISIGYVDSSGQLEHLRMCVCLDVCQFCNCGGLFMDVFSKKGI